MDDKYKEWMHLDRVTKKMSCTHKIKKEEVVRHKTFMCGIIPKMIRQFQPKTNFLLGSKKYATKIGIKLLLSFHSWMFACEEIKIFRIFGFKQIMKFEHAVYQKVYKTSIWTTLYTTGTLETPAVEFQVQGFKNFCRKETFEIG